MSADHGALETIMFRDGFLTEAAASNVWVVHEGALLGPPKSDHVLEGIRIELLRELCLLTAKPVLYVANVSEADIASGNQHVERLKELAASEGASTVMIAGAIEQELGQLDAAEQKEFLADMGLEEPGLHRLIRAGYELLGLLTYFTVGEKETRAWTITKGTTAPGAAGKIHTDFERGFIRAEVIAYEDYVACGSEAAARDKGLLRSEGKEYIVKDGDCILFRFNV